jgi:hypothetical protein
MVQDVDKPALFRAQVVLVTDLAYSSLLQRCCDYFLCIAVPSYVKLFPARM